MNKSSGNGNWVSVKRDETGAIVNHAPPMDGTPIKARGRVIGEASMDEWNDSCEPGPTCTVSEPFEAVIEWRAEQGQLAGWHYVVSGLAVAAMVDDKVYIDEWQTFFPVTKQTALNIHEIRAKVNRQQMLAAALQYRESIHPGSQYGHSGPFMFEHNCSMAVQHLARAIDYRREAERCLARAS